MMKACCGFISGARQVFSSLFRGAFCAGLLIAAGAKADYYVATNGSDSAAGTLSAPWATIQYAVDHAGAGDAVVVRGGIFHERIVFHKSGIEGSPLTLRNYTGEVAVIDGAGFTVGASMDALVTVTLSLIHI